MKTIIRKFLIRNSNDIYSTEIFDFYQDALKVIERNQKNFKLTIEWKDFLVDMKISYE